jgi:hypothetical protein
LADAQKSSTISADIFWNMNRFFLCCSLLILSVGTFLASESFAGKESTLTVSFQKWEDSPNVLKQGEIVRIGKLDFVADGGKIDVERITVDIEGTIDPDDILRAKLYTEWDTYIGAADIQEDNITFSQMKDFSVGDGKQKSLLFEVEMSQNAEIGKTAGFRLQNENAVYVLSEKYDKRYVELSGDAEIRPLVVLDDASDTLLLASIIPKPEYKTGIQAGEEAVFGTFRLEVFGENDVTVEEISFRKSGSVGDFNIQNIQLKKDGDSIAESTEFSSQRIVFTEPIEIESGSFVELEMEMDIGSSAKTGENLFFEIPNSWDITGIIQDSEEELVVYGDFPIRSNTKTVADSGVRFKVASENPSARRVLPDAEDITLLVFTVESAVDDIDFDRFSANIIGNENSIKNIRLREQGSEKETPAVFSDSDTIIFSPEISQQAGQQFPYEIVADADVQQESYVSLIIPDATFTSISGAEIQGDFPLTGSTVTIGKTPEANSAEVSLRREAETLIENMPDAVLCSVKVQSQEENAQVQELIFRVDSEEGLLSNIRLVDEYGNIMATPSAVLNNTIVFTDPFPAPKRKSIRFFLIADIGDTEQEKEFSVSIESPPDIFGLESKTDLSVVGNFPLRAEGIDVEMIPEDAFVGYGIRLFPGDSVQRGTSNVVWGQIELTAYRKDIRIDRMLLLKGGEPENGITNVRLTEKETEREYSGDTADSSYIFDDEIRLDENETKTLLLVSDIRQVAPLGEEFWFSIAGGDQFRASANGKEIPVIGHQPQRSSTFSIAETEADCSVIPDRVCGRIYGKIFSDVWYINSCELEKAGALEVHPSYCSGNTTNKTTTKPTTETPENSDDSLKADEEGTQKPQTNEFFADVSENHENKDAILALKNANIVQGFEDGSFQPENEISRAAFTKIVIGAVFSENEIKSCLSEYVGNSEQTAFFPDVPVQEWFAPYVCVAKTEGIINGFPDGTFKPEKNISFAEAAKIVGISYGAEGDEDDIWYAPFVRFLAEKNAIPVSIDALEENITRAQMAEIIYRIKDNIEEKASRTADTFL